MPIITISRQMGTGARAIAREVAKKLKYRLIDTSEIYEGAACYGLSPESLDRYDEKPPAYSKSDDRLHELYLNTIALLLLDHVRQDNVIVYGRGGQDILKGLSNVLRVRFVAPFEERVENFAEREWLDPDYARELIRKSDHQRSGFIHYYFDRDWNDPLGYDLIYNTLRMSHAAVVESLTAAAKDSRLRSDETTRVRLEDILLEKKIETEMLKSEIVEYLHFKIEVTNGAALLSGHVHSNEEKKAAIAIAGKVPGIGSVEGALQVVTYRDYKH